jgi:hypothetical protein
MRTHMAMRLVLLAALGSAIAAPAYAEDTSGGAEKSIAPRSLSDTPPSTSGSNSSSQDGKAQDAKAQDAKDAGSGGSAASDAASKAGGSPQGRNNTMDDSGLGSAGPAEGPRR